MWNRGNEQPESVIFGGKWIFRYFPVRIWMTIFFFRHLLSPHDICLCQTFFSSNLVIMATGSANPGVPTTYVFWRNNKNYPSIILKYPSNLFFWTKMELKHYTLTASELLASSPSQSSWQLYRWGIRQPWHLFIQLLFPYSSVFNCRVYGVILYMYFAI